MPVTSCPLPVTRYNIGPAVFGDPKTIGVWKFIPKFAADAIRQDVELVYGP